MTFCETVYMIIVRFLKIRVNSRGEEEERKLGRKKSHKWTKTELNLRPEHLKSQTSL